MSYKYSKGSQVIGDLKAADDTQRDTLIDFGEDYIGLETSGSVRMVISGSSGKVGIGTTTPDYALHVAGDVGVDQYIYHNADADTLIRFTDDKIVMKAGNKAMVTMEEKGSAPHEVTINDGSNNIDFVVKGNGSGGGNPGMKFDASTNRLGVNGVGTPDKALHVGGSVKLDGTEPTIFFADDAAEKAEIGINNSDNIVIENKTINKHIVFKVNDQGVVKEGLRLDGAVPEVVVNQASDSLVDFRVESNNQTHMLFVDGSEDKVGIGTGSPTATLSVSGTLDVSGSLTIGSGADKYTLPTVDGSAYQVLKTDGNGAVSWQPEAGGGGGSTQLVVTSSNNVDLDASHNGGTIIIIPISGNRTYKLPDPTSNYKVKILAGTNLDAHNIIFKTKQSSSKIFGMLYRISFGGDGDTGYDTSPQSYIGAGNTNFAGGASEVHMNTITIDNALQGTDIDFYSDGAYWYVKGTVVAAAAGSGTPATITFSSGSY